MSKHRKKPVVVDAFRVPAVGDEAGEYAFLAWAKEVGFTDFTAESEGGVTIKTLEGDMKGDPGDWVIKGVKGEFYPCKPDIFAATYEDAADEKDMVVLRLKAPVKLVPSDNYSIVLRDAEDSHYFFLPDGKYDGYDKTCTRRHDDDSKRSHV